MLIIGVAGLSKLGRGAEWNTNTTLGPESRGGGGDHGKGEVGYSYQELVLYLGILGVFAWTCWFCRFCYGVRAPPPLPEPPQPLRLSSACAFLQASTMLSTAPRRAA